MLLPHRVLPARQAVLPLPPARGRGPVELWEWLEQRWAKLTSGFGAGYGSAGPQGAQEREAAELAALY